ncbi:hypothetical protein PM082_018297 [Marasmius tenuissimus]|nr:hypothetical protein PM082_018297 [Marasmius tenuissimus]
MGRVGQCTLFITSCHHLAVETLRWSPNNARENRLCRFCRVAVEDELHAAFECDQSPELVIRRERFYRMLNESKPERCFGVQERRGIDMLNEAMDDPQLRNTLASFIHNVLVIYDATPVYRAPRCIQDSGGLSPQVSSHGARYGNDMRANYSQRKETRREASRRQKGPVHRVRKSLIFPT